MTPQERIAQLRDEVNYHLYRYHVLDSPVVSNAQYDALSGAAGAGAENPALITPDSPTQRAGRNHSVPLPR